MQNLSAETLKLFAEGVLSGADVQRLAAAAVSDGWGVGDNLAQRLASAGIGGTHNGNVQRDVFRAARAAGLAEDTPEAYVFEAPGPDGGKTIVNMVLTHEMHHKISENDDMATFCVPPEELVEGPSLGGMLLDWSRHPGVNLGGRQSIPRPLVYTATLSSTHRRIARAALNRSLLYRTTT